MSQAPASLTTLSIGSSSAASVAEVVWAYQFLATLQSLRHASPLQLGQSVGYAGKIALFFAVIAEGFSWTNLITTNNVWAVVEQALWSGLFAVFGFAFLRIMYTWTDHPFSYRVLALLLFAMSIEQCYEAFGLYLRRYLDDEQNGVEYNSLVEGFKNLCSCTVVDKSLESWMADLPWMTGYFTVAVWSSIWMTISPIPKPSDDELFKFEPLLQGV
jgi:hypothetical protein